MIWCCPENWPCQVVQSCEMQNHVGDNPDELNVIFHVKLLKFAKFQKGNLKKEVRILTVPVVSIIKISLYVACCLLTATTSPIPAYNSSCLLFQCLHQESINQIPHLRKELLSFLGIHVRRPENGRIKLKYRMSQKWHCFIYVIFVQSPDDAESVV